ncbi:hypothetical protein [Rubrolithibacter danxiaensis]|uniref:hypothetical protein n=1 Tax=Rubrolithibacter danxiaensis TaxID=3390805 RepID=UPI003BF77934
MESFMITIGPERGLRIEPDTHSDSASENQGKRFKIFRLEGDDWMDDDNLDIEEVPVDNFLGVITVKTFKDFTFEGNGAFSGNDLLLIAGEIMKHSS